MRFNIADNIKIGNQQVDKVYIGSTMVWENIGLPPQYKRVKCIYVNPELYASIPKGTGASMPHYDTGVILSSESHLMIDYQIIEFAQPVATNAFFFGCRESATSRNFSAIISQQIFNTQWDFGSYTTNRYYSPTQDFNRHKMIVSSDGYNYDGVIAQSITPVTFTCARSCYLYALNHSTQAMCVCKAKIFEFAVSENGILQSRLIPCYRKADSVVGFYDVIKKVFREPSVSNTFIYDEL